MSDAEPEPVKLKCLRGRPGPSDLGRDLQRLLDLPAPARESFWEVLRAYLRPRLDDEAQAAIVNFCARHDLGSEQIAPVVKALRFLFQEAARAGVDAVGLCADVHALVGEDEARELVALVLPWLEDFMPGLLAEIASQAIADHGKLVVATHWRVDHVARADRGASVGVSVAVVTFSYREGDRLERVTLQLLPDQVRALREAADEMLA